jgi:phosphoenolpyruvate-protein kinase (PTS system EI component)
VGLAVEKTRDDLLRVQVAVAREIDEEQALSFALHLLLLNDPLVLGRIDEEIGGAEEVGLYRTEFSFIVRDTFPTQGEQVRIYRKAYEAFPDGPVRFRILDLGGDKFVSDGSMVAARNAFHGYRSIRVLFDHPDVLRDQVRALALAAEDRELYIMIPMVTSMEDLHRAKELIAQALARPPALRGQRAPKIGAMIEVPAAVVPSSIPELKQALAGARLEPMRRAMSTILALSDGRSVAAALRASFE